MLHSFLGLGRVVRVHGNLSTLSPTTPTIRGIRSVTADDCAVIQLQLNTGCNVSILINSALSGFSQEVKINMSSVYICSVQVSVVGPDGYLTHGRGRLVGRRAGQAEEEEVLQDGSVDCAGSGLPAVQAAGLQRMASHLAHALSSPPASRSQPCATFGEGLQVQAVMEAVRQSSESRQWRKVAVEEGELAGPGA